MWKYIDIMLRIYWNFVVTLKVVFFFHLPVPSEHRTCSHIVKRTVKSWQIGILDIISSFDFTHEI